MVLKMGHLHFMMPLHFFRIQHWFFFSVIVYEILYLSKRGGGGMEYSLKSSVLFCELLMLSALQTCWLKLQGVLIIFKFQLSLLTTLRFFNHFWTRENLPIQI